MTTIQYIQQYIDKDPENISFKSGRPYMSIDVIRTDLNACFGFWGWSDSNFVYTFVIIGQELWINGSILLTVRCLEMERTVSGGASERVSSFAEQSIDNIVGSINSMCLTNAARKLGRRFGSELYATEGEETPKEKPKEDKDEAYEALKQLLKDTPDRRTAARLLGNSSYPEVMELINIVKKKK